MSLTAEMLAEIDVELDTFGKSDETLAAVTARARQVATALAGDEYLGELLDGCEEAVMAARESAMAKIPSRIPPAGRSTALGRPAPSLATSETPPLATSETPLSDLHGDDLHASDTGEDEALGSGLVEIPEAELRMADLPPVLELGDEPVFRPEDEPVFRPEDEPVFRPEPVFRREEVTTLSSRPPPPDDEMGMAFAKSASSDIHGMSVDELFADAAPTPSQSDPSELAELFAPAEEDGRVSDPDPALSSLVKDQVATDLPPRPRTMPPPIPAAAAASKAPALKAALFEEDDSTTVGSLGDLLSSDDDFELLVDDDVLELDSSELELPTDPGTQPTSAPAQPATNDDEQKGGLISRILGRK